MTLPPVPMPIVTPRLLIRAPQPGDGAATAKAIVETWDDLHRWMLWAERREDHTAELQEVRARHVANAFLLRTELNLVGLDRTTGEPVVWTGFHDIDWPNRECQTGYWVRRSRQGQGVATEACNALVRYAFGALGMQVLRIAHAAGNDASQRVIRKLGFQSSTVEVQGSALPDGRVADKLWYQRTDALGLPRLEASWTSEPEQTRPETTNPIGS